MALCAPIRASIGAQTRSPRGGSLAGTSRNCRSQAQQLSSRFERLVTRLYARGSGGGDVVIPGKSFALPLGLLGGAALAYTSDNLALTAVLGILGGLLAFQATRVQFKFSKTTLEVLVEGVESQENVFVGGKNEWRFDTFTNWEFWWPNFPILVYFKETQTKPEGQIHFFPIIMNGKELYDVMVERCGPSMNSGPK